MDAAHLLRHVRAAGFVLETVEDKLLVMPASLLSDELRVALRACRSELIEMLTSVEQCNVEHSSHRLTQEQAESCHSPCWSDAEIDAFQAREAHFTRMGRAADATDLAERLTLRDRQQDDRRLCLECSWLGDTGRCVAAATGRLPGADQRLEPVQTILQRCVAFGLRKGLV